jgi:hypothetical protein
MLAVDIGCKSRKKDLLNSFHGWRPLEKAGGITFTEKLYQHFQQAMISNFALVQKEQ